MSKISSEKLISIIPVAGDYKKELDSLNNQLGKTTLTGKISSLDVAETLFAYMEETQDRFSKLQQGLVDSLVEENIKKATFDIENRAKYIVDTVTLFIEKSINDVLFFNDVPSVINSLEKASIDPKASEMFDKFINRYQKYDDVILFDKNEKIIYRKDRTAPKGNVNDTLAADTIRSSDNVVSTIKKSSLTPRKNMSVFFSAKVVDPKTTECLGVIALSFNVQKIMDNIFTSAKIDKTTVAALLDSTGFVIASSNETVYEIGSHVKTVLGDSVEISKLRGVDALVKSKANIHTPIFAKKLLGHIVTPITVAFSKKNERKIKIDEDTLENSHLISEELKQIRFQSEEINEDLIDVVINGEIIASKKRAYALNPILENIRIISERINIIFSNSIQDIHNTVIGSKLDDVQGKAQNSVRLINLYLQALSNDVRTIASLSEIRRIVTTKLQNEDDKLALGSIIEQIKNEQPVYKNIFVFNNHGSILAVGNQSDARFVNTLVESDIIRRALSTSESETFFSTGFNQSIYYQNERTYIYSSPIIGAEGTNRTVGAVAVVFDSKVHLTNILMAALPREKDNSMVKGSSVMIANKNGEVVLAVGDAIAKVGEKLQTPPKFYTVNTEDGFSDLVSVADQDYAIGCCLLKSNQKEDSDKEDLVLLVSAKI